MVTATANATDPASVMLFGTFHFQNTGKDLVKTKDMDIFAEA
ncbi:MAG: hypothetical protein ACI9H8_001656 [Lysobacterales bacterium]